MLTKPIEELSLIDIEELVKKTRFSESERIEYKENLPDNGKVSDPWHRGKIRSGSPSNSGMIFCSRLYRSARLRRDVLFFAFGMPPMASAKEAENPHRKMW